MSKSTFTAANEALRAELVKIRGRAGLTQRGLAEKLGVPHSWVAKVELGERRLDVIEFIWICDACGADAAAILRQLAGPAKRGGRARA